VIRHSHLQAAKCFKTAFFVVVIFSATSLSISSPPTQVGNSFLDISFQFRGQGSRGLYFLGNDGSARLLLNEIFNGPGLQPTYGQSQEGTYTFVPTPGNPGEATLSLNLPGGSSVYVLEFTGDTYGFPDIGGESSFSFLLSAQNSFLTNVSNRVTLRSTDAAITGFVIQGNATRYVLIRTIGPTLAQFGVSPVAEHPMLNLYFGTGTDLLASGQPWGAVTGNDAQSMSWIFQIAGAFQLQSNSNDSVYFALLNPGNYTVQTSDGTTGTIGGSALTEVYILPFSGSPEDPFLNLEVGNVIF
jgi:hypothetical protein